MNEWEIFMEVFKDLYHEWGAIKKVYKLNSDWEIILKNNKTGDKVTL